MINGKDAEPDLRKTRESEIFLLGGVDMERWLAFRRNEPEAFAAFMLLRL